jgi:hypothetical protein
MANGARDTPERQQTHAGPSTGYNLRTRPSAAVRQTGGLAGMDGRDRCLSSSRRRPHRPAGGSQLLVDKSLVRIEPGSTDDAGLENRPSSACSRFGNTLEHLEQSGERSVVEARSGRLSSRSRKRPARGCWAPGGYAAARSRGPQPPRHRPTIEATNRVGLGSSAPSALVPGFGRSARRGPSLRSSPGPGRDVRIRIAALAAEGGLASG